MRRQRKINLLLLAALVFFSAGTLLLKLTERKAREQDAPEKAYYLTAYEDPEDLLAVQVSNETGTLTVVHHEGVWFTDTELEGIEPDEEAVTRLFDSASRIRVSAPIEGAAPEDEQFGLTEPSAKVLIEDRNENGISFLIGHPTPDGSARYVCASGGKEVCLLAAERCDGFLEDTHRYLDLRIFGEIDPERITKLSVSVPEGMRYELSSAGKGQITGTRYYSLTDPVRIPVALSQVREIFSSISELRAVTVSDEHVADGQMLYVLSLTQEEEEERVFRIGFTEGQKLCIENVTSGMTGVIEELPEWLKYDAAGVLGGSLLSLNSADVNYVELSADGETVRTDYTAENDDTGLIADLNRIPVIMTEHSAGTGKEALRCSINTKREEEELELVFFEAGDRQYEISVNGTCVFSCAASALQPLIDRIAGT